jgi:hypothetical protein
VLDEGIQARAGDTLTQRLAIVAVLLGALVAVMILPVVVDLETTATAPADHQSGEQCRSMSDSSSGLSLGPVLLQTLLVPLVHCPGDVGRTGIRHERMPVSRVHHHPPRLWALWMLAARVNLTATVDVGAGVQRMLCTVTRNGRCQTSSPFPGPSRTRTPSSIRCWAR